MSEAPPAETLVTKGEFARRINVSAGRVSQMISEGKIGADAIEGEGRGARIRLELACQQIGQRTDMGQRLGNGAATQLFAEMPAPRPPTPADPYQSEYQRQRLQSLVYDNERKAEERLAERGRYVRTDHAKAAMVRVAGAMMTVIEGGIADIAQAMAAKHGLAARDVQHTLAAEFRVVREKAAEAFRKEAQGHDRLLVDDVPDATDPAAGAA
ncbi:MAG: hypothetical protein JSR98_20115 [Proteobacteria bacterium]|nr:hypothetical protein [Pseudomonadota bacterium]